MNVKTTLGALATIGTVAISTLALAPVASAATPGDDAHPIAAASDRMTGPWVMHSQYHRQTFSFWFAEDGTVKSVTGQDASAARVSIPAAGASAKLRILDGPWAGSCIGSESDGTDIVTKPVDCAVAPTVLHTDAHMLLVADPAGGDPLMLHGRIWSTTEDVTIADSLFDPATDAVPVSITSPRSGETVNTLTPTFAGAGDPGAAIVVKDAAGNALGSTTVGANGDWAVPTSTPLPEGPVTATAEQTDIDGDTTTATVDFIVADGEGIPAIQPLMAGGAGMLAAIGAAGVFVRRRTTQRA